ncbi:MAG TPA: hypothetical protein VGD81_10420 [Opitutaceae bacterium]
MFIRGSTQVLFGVLLLTGSAALPTASAAEPAPSTASAAAFPDAGGWRFTEVRRIPAAEARQGVAADAEFVYAISNHAIGKYRKATGERVGAWECPEGEPLTHLNAAIVRDGRLVCAHSNFPAVPMTSSVEIWDTATLRPVASHSLGRTDGSLTWLDWRDGRWLACFVHYGRKGGEPGRGPEWTRLVAFDAEWRETGGWSFPPALLARVGARGYSVSGGAFGPGGRLFVTGHDHPELYVLELPAAGSTLRWIATVPIAAQGQAFGWDPEDPTVLYTIARGERAVIVGRLESPADVKR